MSAAEESAPDRGETSAADRRLCRVAESARDFAILTTDAEGRIDTWNVGAELLLGYTRDEAVGQPLALIFTPEDRETGVPEAEMRQARETGRAEDERLHQRKNGTRFYASGVLTALRGDGQREEFEGFAKILRDLTGRRRTEEALRASEERYRTLFDSIDEGFCVVEVLFQGGDPQREVADCRFLEVNPAFEKQTGLADARGRTARELVPDLEQHWFDTQGRVARTGDPTRFEHRSRRNDRWYEVHSFRVSEPDARHVAILFKDVTERKDAEAESAALRAGLAADLDAMGRLHELSTRLVMAAGGDGGGGGGAALGGVLEEVLDATIGLQGADFGFLQLYDPETGRLFIAAHRGFEREFLDHFANGVTAGEDAALAGARALARGRRVIVEDVRSDPAYAPLRKVAAAAGYRAVQSTPLFSRDGAPLGVLSTHFRAPHHPGERELTLTDLYARLAAELIERKQDEQALRDSEARLRLALEATGQGIWEWDVASGRVHWSPAAYAITGMMPGQTSADVEALRSLVHPDDREIVRKAEEAARTGEPFHAEYRLVRPDGQVRWVSNHARVVRDGAGNPTRMIGTLADITARKGRERDAAFLAALSDALRPLSDPVAIQSEAARRLGRHLAASRVAYIEVDAADGSAAGPGIDYTDGVPPLTGSYRIGDYHPTLLADLSGGRTVAEADATANPALTEAQRAAIAAASIRAHVTVPLVKGGRLVALLGIHQATPREWTPGEVALAGEVTERTWAAVERARAEEALRRSEARLAAIFAQAEVGISEIAPDGRFLRVNDALCRMLGRTPEELLRATVADVSHPDDLPASLEAVRGVIETGAAASIDKRYRRPDGVVVWANSSLSRLDDEPGRPPTLLAATVDLTDRKRAEDALRRANDALEERVAERTRTLSERTDDLTRVNAIRQELLRQLVTAQEAERGRISRELHDELGQFVTALQLGLGALRDDTDPAGTVERLQAITGALAQVAHRLSFALRPTALDDLGLVAALTNYVEEWQHWSGGVPVDLAAFGVGDGAAARLPPEVESTIYRVVQEALTNVLRHALRPGGGPGGGGAAGASCVSVLVHRLPGGGEVLATVEDDGPGFDPEAVLSLAPENRRLGLLGMRERAALVGGTVTIESEPGSGTTLLLRLPLPRHEAPPPQDG